MTDRTWLRERLEELEQIDRPSASEGERQAAEWIVARFAELGAEARIEAEPAHGTFWWPVGIGAALGALAGFAELRDRRLLGTLLGAAFYHWPNDVAENVELDTVADGIRLSEAAVRRLDERWL